MVGADLAHAWRNEDDMRNIRGSEGENRNSAMVWWLLVVTACVFIAGQIAIVTMNIASGRGAILMLPAIVISVFIGTGLALAVWARPQYVRSCLLRERFPGKLVIPVQGFSSEGDRIAAVLGKPLRVFANGLGSLSVLVVDDQGIGFWKGWRKPFRKYLVPWDLIESIWLGEAVYGRPLPAIYIRMHLDEAYRTDPYDQQEGTVAFFPCREGWRIGFAHLDPGTSRTYVAQMGTMRPAS